MYPDCKRTQSKATCCEGWCCCCCEGCDLCVRLCAFCTCWVFFGCGHLIWVSLQFVVAHIPDMVQKDNLLIVSVCACSAWALGSCGWLLWNKWCPIVKESAYEKCKNPLIDEQREILYGLGYSERDVCSMGAVERRQIVNNVLRRKRDKEKRKDKVAWKNYTRIRSQYSREKISTAELFELSMTGRVVIDEDDRPYEYPFLAKTRFMVGQTVHYPMLGDIHF